MIDAYIPAGLDAGVLLKEKTVRRVTLVETPFTQTETLRTIAKDAKAPYILLFTKNDSLQLVAFALERMLQIAADTDAVMLYSDRFITKAGQTHQAPVIDYQEGSLRDDFDFGALLLIKRDALKKAAGEMDKVYSAAGLYDLRLHLSRLGRIEHIAEYLYYEIETDLRTSGQKQFDYVDPKNRRSQIEMEDAVTAHLKAVGGYLKPRAMRRIDPFKGDFPVEASVVIPCKNRAKTIADAIRSALSQKTDFPFNVIVVDDNSTDGTIDIIKSFADDPRLVYIAQDPSWHAIGGNWNSAIHHPLCGRFAIQLDSDDVYSGTDTVQKFVDAFRAQKAAMIIGCYAITDFEGNPLPPFIVEHREWTPGNGRNNALRINGLGAPRAFWVPLLRELNFPTTKYGEDYALGLRISRHYRIGRIWDVLYNCRRWDGNSDSDLSIEKVNANNYYKDRIRSWELKARQKMNLKTK